MTRYCIVYLLIVTTACGQTENSPAPIKKIPLVRKVGIVLDSLNGIYVYYNGSVSHTGGRTTHNGYNLGLKYQCVEFVKRYYYYHYHHKMPDSYGHAKDFFDARIKDGNLNKPRNLLQFTNSSNTKPRVGDLVVFGPTAHNPYGHVAIISAVSDTEIEIIQQNPGKFASSRATFGLHKTNGKWKIEDGYLLGWLRKK